MLRTVLFIIVTAALFLLCYQAEAAQISVSWDGGGDGHSWADPCNWDPNIVPDNNASQTFFVTINGGSGEPKYVAFLTNHIVDQLDCYGNVWLVSELASDIVFTVVGPNGFTNHGNLRLLGRFADAHHFEIHGSVTNESGAALELFHTTIEDGFYNALGAPTAMNYANNFPNGAWNDGAINIYPVGQMDSDANVTNTGQIQIFGGLCATTQVLHNDANGLIHGFGVTHSGYKTRNEGTIYALDGSLVLHSDNSLTNTGTLASKPSASLHIKPANDVNNQGTIKAHAGGGVVFDCNLVNDVNGLIKLHGGTLAATTITQSADANFAGFGTISGDIVIDPNGLIKLTGPTNIVGDVNIPANATLKISDGQTLITGFTTCDGTIKLVGGTVIFQSGCDCNDCVITHNPGKDRNYFDINSNGIVNFEDFAAFAESWLWQATWH